ILRRVTGSLRQTEGFEELPDLILIDGGKGQLSSAVSVLEETGEFPTPIIGLAKRNEEIYKPHSQTPVILPRTSKALRLLQRVRDESHRFAITYHKNLRAKHMKESILDNIEGIGPVRRKALMRAFGSLEKMKKASAEEIAAAGVPKNVALRITEILKGH
ncbi:MAG: excinuclease ABC subunit C, partial [Abditibacteriota bacterium]|nr:excinuclease ABC subunit C [Abditibacteriota bacterium]